MRVIEKKCKVYTRQMSPKNLNESAAQYILYYILYKYILGLHDISHAIFNAHLVSEAGPVISGNFHHVRDFTWSSIYHTESLFTDKLHKTTFIINLDLHSLSVNNGSV